MASTNLQQLGCCNSHLSSSPKFLSGLLQFERQEPQKCLLSFLCWLVKGPKAVVEKFLVPSSLQVMSNFGREFAEIPKAQQKTSKSIQIQYYQTIFQRRLYTPMNFPQKIHPKIPTSTAVSHRNRPNVSPTEDGHSPRVSHVGYIEPTLTLEELDRHILILRSSCHGFMSWLHKKYPYKVGRISSHIQPKQPGFFFAHMITKTFKYLKWRVFRTLFSAILGVGSALERVHKKTSQHFFHLWIM